MKNSSQLRILLVDGDSSVRMALEDFLRARGYDIRSTGSGLDAMRSIREAPDSFDVVLTDLTLPDADGLDVLDVARQRDSRTQVVTMPGFAALDKAIESIRLGAFDYVTKPFKFTQVDVALNKVAERRKLVEENEKLAERVQSLYSRLDILKDNRDRLERFMRDLFEKLDYQTEMIEECLSRLRKFDSRDDTSSKSRFP